MAVNDPRYDIDDDRDVGTVAGPQRVGERTRSRGRERVCGRRVFGEVMRGST